MAKFKIGDQVRVIKEHDYFEIGEILTVDEDDFPPRCISEKTGKRWAVSENKLELVEKTLDTLEVGDVLVDKDGSECQVLGVCGRVIFLSLFNDFDMAGDYYTKEELKSRGYKLKQPDQPQTPKQMTHAEIEEALGYRVEIV